MLLLLKEFVVVVVVVVVVVAFDVFALDFYEIRNFVVGIWLKIVTVVVFHFIYCTYPLSSTTACSRISVERT